MRDLPSLIATLEAATEGSAELDRAICRAISGDETQWHKYTRSLDAAMTLVPEGWFALIDTRGRADVRYAPIDQSGYRREVADAATPALALCIAALRARLAIDGKE